jgi:hypothetical protein
MSKRGIIEHDDHLPANLNLAAMAAIMWGLLLSLCRGSKKHGAAVISVARRSRLITLRRVIVTTSIGTLFASFALQMELLSVFSALSIFFAMQETDSERKARVADEVSEHHAKAYSEELARQLARKEAQQRHQQDDLSACHFRARRSESGSDSVTYH